MPTDKKPWESKTLVISALLGIVTSLLPFIPALSVVSDYINSHGVVLGIIWSVLAFGLRLITKGAISLGD